MWAIYRSKMAWSREGENTRKINPTYLKKFKAVEEYQRWNKGTNQKRAKDCVENIM